MTEQNPKNEQVSDRRFRRYHRATERRRKAARADAAFFRAVFAICGVAAALVIGIAAFVMNGGQFDPAGLQGWATPWIGPASKIEVVGLVFVAIVGGLYFWRIRRK